MNGKINSNIYFLNFKKKHFAFLFVSFFIISCSNEKEIGNLNFINCNNNDIRYVGRIDRSNKESSTIFWSGSQVEMNFEGKELKVLLKDERGLNYFYAIIDNSILIKFKPDTEKKYIPIVSDLKQGSHNIKIFKLTEQAHGKTWFYGFAVSKEGKILKKPAEPKRKMEFYGNSITSAYSLEDTIGDSRKPEYFNNYLSFGALTARHFNADFSCISQSGIGVMVSWFPVIMPELYDRLDPSNTTEKWNFNNYTPDIVVINLLSNDIDLTNMKNDENFIARFGTQKPNQDFIVSSYRNFVKNLRNKYPDAYIICTLDAWKDIHSDGHVWPGYITKAVSSLNDNKIMTHFFDYKRSRMKGHPKSKDHEAMAESLIKFIDENIKW